MEKDDKHFLFALNNVIQARGGLKKILANSSLTKQELVDIFNHNRRLNPEQLRIILSTVGLNISETKLYQNHNYYCKETTKQSA